MTTNTEVKVFQSTDTSAPTLSGTAGALITVLDACLVNGYGSVTLDSLVVASNVATCTKSTGHGFTALSTTGPVIRMSGATGGYTALNADWRITVVSATVFTFTTTGLTDTGSALTGIDAKRAPLGFSKIFTGTNKAAYRADNTSSTRFTLRVADDGTGSAVYARLRGYEAISDSTNFNNDTGTGPFPTNVQQSGGSYLHKSTSANSSARAWRIIGDDRAFYLFAKADNTNWDTQFWFGDLVTNLITDTYHCGLIGMIVTAGISRLSYLNNSTQSYLARSYLQTGGSIAFSRYGHRLTTTYIGYNGGVTYPDPVGGGLLAYPIEANESSILIRGLMPGLYTPLHSVLPDDNTVVESMSGIAGHAIWVIQGGSIERFAFDISGPWR